jgi:hypothetical protein
MLTIMVLVMLVVILNIKLKLVKTNVMRVLRFALLDLQKQQLVRQALIVYVHKMCVHVTKVLLPFLLNVLLMVPTSVQVVLKDTNSKTMAAMLVGISTNVLIIPTDAMTMLLVPTMLVHIHVPVILAFTVMVKHVLRMLANVLTVI